MAQRTYTSAEVSVPHVEMLRLRNAGDLNLGIGHDSAQKIANTPELSPTKAKLAGNFRLRNFLAVGVFAYSIYLAFIDEWWHVLFGLAFMLMLGRSAQKLNVQRILGAAEIDSAFYETVRDTGAWLYRIDETKAGPFLTTDQEPSRSASA